jgi:hypothetical protein
MLWKSKLPEADGAMTESLFGRSRFRIRSGAYCLQGTNGWVSDAGLANEYSEADAKKALAKIAQSYVSAYVEAVSNST